jgi:hypothetical protein
MGDFLGRRTGRRAVILTGAVAMFLAGMVPVSARIVTVSGEFRSERIAPPACTSPVALCTAGRSTGDVVGPFTLTGTSIIPTAQTATTGVVAYTADVVQHTRNGDLFCKDTGVTKVVGDGAASSICVVTGGTGIYSGASGYIQFQSTLIPPVKFAGTSQGKLTGAGRVPDEGDEDEGED